MERRFCSVCGSHVFAYNADLDEWYLAAGLIEMPDPSIEGALMQTTKVVRHEFVADTLDGGLASCLETIQGRELDLFAQGPDEEPMSLKSAYAASTVAALDSGDEKKSDPSRAEDRLHASCHCGGVQFKLSRPNERSSQLSSPWPDLLVPYHSNSPSNDGDIKWWLRANKTKYLAGICACRSCRLAAGFVGQPWAFVPKANITTRDGRALSFALGILKQFKSSPGVYREFCGRCGATVFWHSDERPDLIDVSVGLLRANEGSRAMKWLDWWMERVSFKEDAVDTELMDALESGLPRIVSKTMRSGSCNTELTSRAISFYLREADETGDDDDEDQNDTPGEDEKHDAENGDADADRWGPVSRIHGGAGAHNPKDEDNLESKSDEALADEDDL